MCAPCTTSQLRTLQNIRSDNWNFLKNPRSIITCSIILRSLLTSDPHSISFYFAIRTYRDHVQVPFDPAYRNSSSCSSNCCFRICKSDELLENLAKRIYSNWKLMKFVTLLPIILLSYCRNNDGNWYLQTQWIHSAQKKTFVKMAKMPTVSHN